MSPAAGTRARTGLRGRDFTLLLLATFGALSNYAPLLSVVPLWAAVGGSGGTGVGATTGVVMGTTVLTQLSMGRLLRLLSLRRMLGLGALLLGAVTPAYALSAELTPVLVVSALRGVGFAMVVVAGSALVAELIPPQQWGKGAGVYGLATGLPSVVCLPLGVWAAQEVGFVPVFLATTALSLAAVPLVLAMGPATDGAATDQPPGAGAETAATPPPARVPLTPLAGPWLLLLAAAFAFGGVTTFLPLALASPTIASVALLALSVSMIGGRWGAGALGDVLGSGRLVPPAVVVAAVGMGGLSVGVEYGGVVTVASAALYGLGFGAIQNDTLVVMLRRAGRAGNGVASTVWNIAYDAGTGAGAVLLGMIVAASGHTWAFTVAAVAIAVTAPVAWRESRR